MNFKLIIAVFVALAGSAVFGFLISLRGNLTESWMRSLDFWLAYAILGGAFIVAYKVKDSNG